MIDVNTGIFKIDNALEIRPGYTFDDFKRSAFYNGEDGVRIIYLGKHKVIDGQKYIVSLFFRNNIIYMISLILSEVDYSEKDEAKRKENHDEVLKKNGITSNTGYDWGKISSEYDARSNISSINICYNCIGYPAVSYSTPPPSLPCNSASP